MMQKVIAASGVTAIAPRQDDIDADCDRKASR